MMSRFVQLKKPIKMSLIEISIEISFSDEEFNTLEELIAALEPVKVGTEALCRRDATLISSDQILKFICLKLSMQNSTFSKELLEMLVKRIKERRNPDIINLLIYLNDSEALDKQGQSTDVFDTPQMKQNALANTAAILFCCLFEESYEDEDKLEEECQEIPNIDEGQSSLAEQLEQSIKDALKCPSISKRMRVGTSSKSLLKEMAVFELTKTRTNNLEMLYNALMAIPVTSVEAERSFSASGLFVTKLRSSLNGNTLDALCILRAYFLLKKAQQSAVISVLNA